MARISQLAAIGVLVLGGLAPCVVAAQDRPTATGPGGYISVGAGVSAYQFNYGERKLGGIMAYTDIQPSWRFGIEGEVRSLRYNTDEDVTETTYMAGPRVVVLPAGHLRPYVKLLAGVGHYNLPFNFAQGNFFTYAPGAGVDIALNNFVSVRVIDFEYQVTTKFQASVNEAPSQLVNYGISAGISFRVTPLSRIPWVRGYKKRPYGLGSGNY